MTTLLLPFMILSGCGFLASAAVHITATFGVDLPAGSALWGLHVGIFVVWLPTVLISMRTQVSLRRKDFWKVALTGCPLWMRQAFYFVFGYAIISFMVFVAGRNVWPLPISNGSWELRGFSGHWMFFYGAAFAVLYSAFHKPSLLEARRCPSGHAVSHADLFCPECGRELRQ